MDCDPGIDDAFAILCALTYGDLAAVTTVSGNVSVDNTTRNAQWILELAGALEVPVHKGAAAPLEIEPVFARDIHGESGLGTFATPDSSTPVSTVDAVDAIMEHCENANAVIVAIGPLTNIAQALLRDPTLATRIERLHWMGGSAVGGNTTPHAEFNSWADPHAVAVTVASNCPLSMYGLDLTYQVRLNNESIAELRDANTPTSVHLADFLSHYRSTTSSEELGQPIHDACAVLGATHPDLFVSTASRIVVETDSADTRGKTTVREDPQAQQSHVHTVDADTVRSMIIRAAIQPGSPC